MSSDEPLLEVRDLKKHFSMTQGLLKKEVGTVRAVDGISFSVREGETFGIVGESGCGKSTAARTILQLEEATAGEVRYRGTDITEFDDEQLKQFRRQAQMIFQDPNSSFDPRMSVGESLEEPMRIHGMNDRDLRRSIIRKLLDRVGLQPDDIDRYPHEFSGGQKQRIGLARALVLNPDLLVADEPVSALDVSIQAEILSLMDDLQQEFGLSIVVISHNLGVVREICDRVAVMYLGEIVEMGRTEDIFGDPEHPYTRALLSSIPEADPDAESERVRLTGSVPDASNPPRGCRFHTRCPEVIPPAEYAFDQQHWRATLNLKQRVEENRLDIETIYELLFPEEEVPDDLEQLPVEEVDAGLREEFDIPLTLPDADAESVLSDVMASLASDDVESAGDLLDAEFESVCQSATPELVEGDEEHFRSCHLLADEDVPAASGIEAND